jgi:hypothetical protein
MNGSHGGSPSQNSGSDRWLETQSKNVARQSDRRTRRTDHTAVRPRSEEEAIGEIETQSEECGSLGGSPARMNGSHGGSPSQTRFQIRETRHKNKT